MERVVVQIRIIKQYYNSAGTKADMLNYRKHPLESRAETFEAFCLFSFNAPPGPTGEKHT
jgi:hypothetical protein